MFNVFMESGKFCESILLVKQKFQITNIYECIYFKDGQRSSTFLTEDAIKNFKGKVILGKKLNVRSV